MLFSVGDQLVNSYNGETCEIKNVLSTVDSYVVLWHSTKKETTEHRIYVERNFKLTKLSSLSSPTSLSSPVLPNGSYYGSADWGQSYYSPTEDPKKSEPVDHCLSYGHTWIDVGFHYSKFVCKKCDKNKE